MNRHWKELWIRALISLAGTVLAGALGAAVGSIVTRWLDNRESFQVRQQSNIPAIMGTRWSAEWLYEDESLYAKDIVTFSGWTKNNQFEGYGEITLDHKQFKYPIVGEVAPSRIVVLTYKAERFPLEGNIGTATLELSSGADELNGYWAGRASLMQNGQKVYTVRSGRVKMQKIKDIKP